MASMTEILLLKQIILDVRGKVLTLFVYAILRQHETTLNQNIYKSKALLIKIHTHAPSKTTRGMKLEIRILQTKTF